MIKKLLAIFIYCILFALLLFLISPIFVPKWNTSDDNYSGSVVRGFYAEKEGSLDVLFMGNSDMYRGIIPIELYDNYGIASYAITSPGQRMWTGYYVLEDALKHQKPKVIFYNVDSIGSTDPSAESNYRKAFDNMKWSTTKIKAILFDDAFEFSLMKKVAFVFPVLRFHDRLSDLTKEDFTLSYGTHPFEYKGYDLTVKTNGHSDGQSYMENKGEEFVIPDKTLKYLDMFVEKCKSEGITLVLTEVPSSESWSYAKSETLAKYAKEKGVTFLDLNKHNDEIKIDWKTDTPDKGDHLNIYGAEKVTKFIGKYLDENFDLPDRRLDKNYSIWESHSKVFHRDAESLKNEIQNN